jgi:hypothetical protein
VSTEKFIEERKYLKGVSEKTLAWYKDSSEFGEGRFCKRHWLARRA